MSDTNISEIGNGQDRPAIGWMAVVTLLLSFQALAQEPEAEQAQAQPVTPLVLLAVDAPVAVLPGIDPAMLAPEVVLDPEDDPEFIQRLDSIREYDQVVADIELTGGVWDRKLIEELTALGSLQQQQGYHPEAIETLGRAIHINRITTGLHTLDQIPSVEHLIESYMAVGDLEQADLYNNYLFYVQQKAYGPNDPRIIPVLDSLAKWNIYAFNIGYGEALGMRLSTAMILFSAAARMVGMHYGNNDERYINYMKDIANSAYLVARNPDLMAEVNRPENRNVQQMLRDKLNERRTTELPRGFSAGERALSTVVNFYRAQENSVNEVAEALVELGDWYLLFERRRAATELYTEAWQLLSATEDGDSQLQQLFAQVVPVPTFANQAANFADATTLVEDLAKRSSAYVDFVFDVTVYGVVRNIEMLSEASAENSNLLRQIRRQLRNTKYRPVIKEGRPVRSSGNHFRYRYWY